jgi:ferredoxin-NADP reductase
MSISDSKFKNELMLLKKEDVLEYSGPTGTFVLDENETGDHVLIAGGIGITPFLYFAYYNAQNKLSKLYIIHSIKTDKDRVI